MIAACAPKDFQLSALMTQSSADQKPSASSEGRSSAVQIPVDDLANGVITGDIAVLARAITLMESRKGEHRPLADQLLQKLYHKTGKAYRIGVSGLPGVGKSTFIDQFGANLTAKGFKIAVLAIDPSSQRSRGSILGDKTRMSRLSIDPAAFVRPSPAGRTLGGVARATRETMLLCEAAGFDVIIVETVGVGQSESAVAQMVDFFLLLLLPGAGDELQGVKKGIVERADLIAINKADGDLEARARQTAADYSAALHILTARDPVWTPKAVTISSLHNNGLEELWSSIERHRELLKQAGLFEARRREQSVAWMYDLIEERLRSLIHENTAVQAQLPVLERAVRDGHILPGLAADQLLKTAGIPSE